MARFHVWAAVLIGAVLLAWGVLAQLGVSPAELGDGIEDTTRGFLEGDGAGLSETRNISVLGEFAATQLDLSDSPVAELTLTYDEQSADMKVNGVRVTSGEDTVFTAERYEGTLILDGNRVSIDGGAKLVRVNGVTMDTGSTAVDIEVTGLRADSVRAENIDLRRFRADSLQGTLNVRDQVSVTLDEEPLEMDAFIGDVSMDGQLVVDGRARRVFAGGRDYRTVVS